MLLAPIDEAKPRFLAELAAFFREARDLLPPDPRTPSAEFVFTGDGSHRSACPTSVELCTRFPFRHLDSG